MASPLMVNCLTPETLPQTIDWDMCIICQKEQPGDVLQCPGTKHDGAGYTSIAECLIKLSKIGFLPFDINTLDEGSGIEYTFKKRDAKIHKICRLNFGRSRLKRAEKRRSSDKLPSKSEHSCKYTRLSHSQCQISIASNCFLCGDSDLNESLHEVCTFDMDNRIRSYASNTQDQQLLATLSAGDLVAQEAKYHQRCLTTLHNKARKTKGCNDKTELHSAKINHGIALAELINYIKETKSTIVAPVFKLCELTKLYAKRLTQLGTNADQRVHTTRLRERILANLPTLHAHQQGRDVLLLFKEDIGPAILKACKEDGDDEGKDLVNAANIVRREMLDFTQKSQFDGSFADDAQEQSVPPVLLNLVQMILEGPNIKSTTNGILQATKSISQLLQFNCHVRRRKDAGDIHHTAAREAPLPIYLGLMMHAQTRKRKLIDKLFNLGLSISYDQVLSLSNALGNNVCDIYSADKVVCPPKLRVGLFTTSAVDNIDHNPSSTTAKGSFHGTGVSLFQHPTEDNTGVIRKTPKLNQTDVTSKTIAKLPEVYTSITPVMLPLNCREVPPTNGPLIPDLQILPEALHKENRWLQHVEDLSEVNGPDGLEDLTWASYHSSQQSDTVILPSISSLLPLFNEDSKSTAMIRHSMDVIKAAVNHVNHGQVPCITFDQPLYVLAKQIQWCWPAEYGEGKFVVMLGGLHTEITFWKCLGNWLEGSGWTSALIQADVASPGVADSLLKSAHVTRTKHAHQVTACSLYRLLHKAYYSTCHFGVPGKNTPSFDEWVAIRVNESPQFQYWHITLQLELLILTFVRSIREANFNLYLATLTSLTPWLFALDHTHYARWLPVHIRDMASLQNTHPQIYREFVGGNFVVHKTQHHFSAIAVDQAHEQNNRLVKEDGGAVGLTENPSALLRWMLAGPELARIVTEFEDSTIKQPLLASKHHEQTKGNQASFQMEVTRLSDVIEEFGNPFIEKSKDLLVLDNKAIACADVITSVKTAREIGNKQYMSFVCERLETRTKSLNDPIPKNQLPLFNRAAVRECSKSKLQINSLNEDVSLFSRMYVASQSRESNLDAFFQHENQAYPPSLSQYGHLRHGVKSDLITCLMALCPPQAMEQPGVDVMILDGAVVVNALNHGAATTFCEYADNVFIPHILRKLEHVKRLDIVWDQYFTNSLKNSAREKRGKGVRRRVTPENRLPGDWPGFLRVNENKSELFSFLSKKVIEEMPLEEGKMVCVTCGESVLINPQPSENSNIAPCTHEEADHRILLHTYDAAKAGYQRATIRTVDTDVVVIAVSMFAELALAELWIAFGNGKHFKYIPIHAVALALGQEKAKALRAFHAFTGCDTVSSFNGRGKKTAWEVWNTFHEATDAFIALSCAPQSVDLQVMATLERFVVLLYDRTSGERGVDLCRKNLFTSKGRSLEGIPPTHGALVEHTKRAAYQAGHVWGQALIPSPELPSPSEWGWTLDGYGNWQPVWSLLPIASVFCQELLKCGCKKGCQRNCKCSKAGLKCTALCNCRGICCSEL